MAVRVFTAWAARRGLPPQAIRHIALTTAARTLLWGGVAFTLFGLFALVGSAFGFFLASYTGVLATVTNRPIWADNSVLGLLFLTSAASTAAALLLLLAHRRRAVLPESLHWLSQLDNWSMILELIALIALVVTLGPVAQALFNVWGLLLLGVALIGIVIPLALHWRQIGPPRAGHKAVSR